MSATVPNENALRAIPDKTVDAGKADNASGVDSEAGGGGTKQQHHNKHGRKRKSGGAGGGGGAKSWHTRTKNNDDWGHKPKRRRFGLDRDGEEAGGGGGEASPSYMNIPFSAEEIAAEERRPKRKVAVLIGYAGTGYHGMQINHSEKTIEGDLFRAFVEAGAISKANASDPKKSSLVRCARTDKGVHAAGNVISLKLIIDEEGGEKDAPKATNDGGEGGEQEANKESSGDTVEKDEAKKESRTSSSSSNKDVVDRINSHLPDQIRVWDILRTNNNFNCYHICDSRWYEYLMPSYALLPPHPDSYLGKRLAAAEREKGGYKTWIAKFADVGGFWEAVEERDIKPILGRQDPTTRRLVEAELHVIADEFQDPNDLGASSAEKQRDGEAATASGAGSGETGSREQDTTVDENKAGDQAGDQAVAEAQAENQADPAAPAPSQQQMPSTPAQQAIREIKAAYVAAKRHFRVSPGRVAKLQEALDSYVGTRNYHNYTVAKKHSDPSAKRHIKSFRVDPTPILIRDTEWLSLKVHGQSFMMHQIRKMVAMAVLVVRCGAPLSRIEESYGPRRISIPKAPGLGLLLERPVFDMYSAKARDNFGREPIDFSRYEDRIQKFKEEHIYKRMWDVEERDNIFHVFFHQLDNFNTDYFLWLTAHGFEAAHERKERGERVPKALQAELGEDDEDPEGGEG